MILRRTPQPSRATAPAITLGGLTLTYGDLEARVRRARGWLEAKNVRPGDVVALRLPKCLAFVELHLGALALGATTLPLNPAYTDTEVAFLVDDAGARLVVDDVGVRTELDAADPAPIDVPDDHAVAVLLYTSGTTGRPKGARITVANLVACVQALHQAWRWTDRDVLVHALPLFHVHGLFVAQHGAMWAGAHAVWLPRFDAERVFDAIEHHEATVFMGVPTFYHRFLQSRADPDLSSMRLFTSGSAPLPASVHARFHQRFGHTILERYGMTEVGIVLSNPYDGERRPGAVGFALPGVEARVDAGEIQIRGPSVFEGYHGLPEQTAAAFTADGWLHTGDLGFIDDDGYFHVQGRRSDLVISGGMNVYPREVEAALLRLDAVDEAAVVGAFDPDLGERVVATLVGRPRQDVLTQLRNDLASFKLPKQVRWADALPRNAMGKVQKKLLREQWNEPVIRDGVPADAARIAASNLAMALETESLALDEQTVRAGVEAVFSRDVSARYFIAEVAGAYAGQLMITQEWSDWRNTWVWWIQSVYVVPDYRRRGVYRALHLHVFEAAQASGAAGLRLYVDQRNARAAAVYRAVGMDGEHYELFEQMFPPDH